MNTHPIDTGLPDPEVSNLHKATPEQLAQEFITLRLYVGSLLMGIKEFKQALSELTGSAPTRITDLERDSASLKMRVERLEGRFDSK